MEPTNTSLSSALTNAEARIADDQDESPEVASSATAAPPGAGPGGMDFGAMADMMRGMGGEGGPGGAGGLAGLLNNPAMMQMAQQMMGNGGLEVFEELITALNKAKKIISANDAESSDIKHGGLKHIPQRNSLT